MNVLSGFIKSLSKLSMIGRALMLPISLLPAAGLLLAFGDKFHLPLMMNAGGVIFDNLPLLFAIGSAVGLASESGIAALSAAVSVFVTNITISTVLSITPEMASQGGKYAMVVGIPSLQMGVFGGLICGILAAWCYNRFHTMQLPEFWASSPVSVLSPSPPRLCRLFSACCCPTSGNISRRALTRSPLSLTAIIRQPQPLSLA
jgi:PTS system D-glucosamine-specific IIC component